jgi:hypothetical protein
MTEITTIDQVRELEYSELLKLIEKHGSQNKLAEFLGVSRKAIYRVIKRASTEVLQHRPAPEAIIQRVDSGIRRFILTAAQDRTVVHEGFLQNIEAYRDWLSQTGPCDIYISGFTYGTRVLGQESNAQKDTAIYDERVEKYLNNNRVRLGDRIDWCGEMNTWPTAVTPLSGFESYTQHRWGIFPHTKVQLKSVATMKNEPAKIIMTTGAITKPNYIQRKAGIKASFHHIIGAVLVEISADGTFFARHLAAEEDGSFCDLDRIVYNGQVTCGNRVEAINWGDIHVAQMDKEIVFKSFGIRMFNSYPDQAITADSQSSMLDDLQPKYQFFHDVADFQSRNHHNIKDPHHMFKLFIEGSDSVEEELSDVALFLSMTKRPWCKSVVVESNHDLALNKWLKYADHRLDPPNARFWLECSLEVYKAIERRENDFSIFHHTVKRLTDDPLDDVLFLKTDQSFRVLDIEKGLHGHNGANGGRGSSLTFSKIGSKCTTGHTHTPAITDGAYTSGTKSKLDLGYNLGLSSWSHSDVVTLSNGKRQIITWNNGKYRL